MNASTPDNRLIDYPFADLHGMCLEDLSVGQSAAFSRTVSETDIVMFVGITGDTNPVHIDEEFAKRTMFKTRIAHGMLTAGLISTVLGTKLPGPGCIYLKQTLAFKAPVRIGDNVLARVVITAIDTAKKRVTLDTVCFVDRKVVMEGEAVMMVPSRKDVETIEVEGTAA